MTRRIVDYMVIGPLRRGGLRDRVLELVTVDPTWWLAGPATHTVTPDGDWYTQTLVRYEKERGP